MPTFTFEDANSTEAPPRKTFDFEEASKEANSGFGFEEASGQPRDTFANSYEAQLKALGWTEADAAEAQRLDDKKADMLAEMVKARRSSEYWQGVADRIDKLVHYQVEPMAHHPIASLVGKPVDALIAMGGNALAGVPINSPMEAGAGPVESSLMTPVLDAPRMTEEWQPGGPVVAGVYNAAADLLAAFSSPEAVALLPAASNKAVLTTWISQMAAQTPGRVMRATELFREGKTREAVQEVATGVGELGMFELGRRHLMRDPNAITAADVEGEPRLNINAKGEVVDLESPAPREVRLAYPPVIRRPIFNESGEVVDVREGPTTASFKTDLEWDTFRNWQTRTRQAERAANRAAVEEGLTPPEETTAPAERTIGQYPPEGPPRGQLTPEEQQAALEERKGPAPRTPEPEPEPLPEVHPTSAKLIDAILNVAGQKRPQLGDFYGALEALPTARRILENQIARIEQAGGKTADTQPLYDALSTMETFENNYLDAATRPPTQRGRASTADVLATERPAPTISAPEAAGEPGTTSTPAAETKPGLVSGTAAEAWADRTIARSKTLGIQPTDPNALFAAWVVKGAAIMERGARRFAEWAPRMIAEHGDAIRPHLRRIYEQAKSSLGATAVQFPSPEGRQLGIAAPLPFTRSALAGIHRGAAGLADVIKTIAGQSMPRTTRADRTAGELGVRYASSRIAAPYAARSFVNEVLRGLGVDPVKFGAALTEDNLRSVKGGFLAQGNVQAANQVKTLIGSRNSPFRTEQQYQDFVNRPATQAALARHREAWDAHIAPQYRAAMRLDDSLTLPTRGQQTGARINLYGIREADPLQRPRHIISAQSPNLTATFRRKSPFGRRATGASEEYAVDYHDIMANTFGRQLEIANKNKFDAALAEGGNAVIGPPGEKPTLRGEETVSFPLQRTVMVERTSEGQTKSVPLSANIYVRKSLAREYELAANLYRNRFAESARVLTGGFNRAAMAGLTDATVHLSNLGTVLFTRPMTGIRNPIGDMLTTALGRADIPINIIRAIRVAMRDNSKQLAELAQIGVLRPEQPTWNPAGKAIHWADKTTRLLLDDTFKAMAERGLVENTETARREFSNQAGQYNKRLQGVLTHALRESGIGPFITAGKAFNTLAVRNLLMDPGVKTTSPQAWVTLRAGVAARWVGAIALIGAVNYLLTKDKGGGVAGRPGTPLGRIDTGRDNEAGRPLTVPALDLFGLGRPLRVTGVRGFIESKRLGLDTQAGIDAAARDVVNSWSGPILGPPVRFGVGASTGYSPAMGVGRVHPVVPPGESQFASDVANAVYESNPILATARESGAMAEHVPWMPYADQLPAKPTSEVIARQIPRFTLLPGKPAELIERYPEIVQRAKANAFLEDVIHRSRVMGLEQRMKFLQDSIAKLPPEEQQHAWQEVKRRRVLFLPAAAQVKE